MVFLFAVTLTAGCVAVQGDRVLAGDLAKICPEFATLAPDTTLVYAPAPGVRRTLRRAELARLAHRYSLTSSPTRDVCVERAMERLEPARVVEAMRHTLNRADAAVELIDLTHAQVPKGTIEFPLGSLARPSAADSKAPVLWRGFVRYAGKHRFPIFARVKITVRAKRVVAVVSLPAGKPIPAEQVRIQEGPAAPLDFGFAYSLEQAVGRIPRRAIASGEPLSLNLLEAPKDVASGDTVSVDVTSSSAHVRLEARAEAAGRKGDWILVRNIDTGKRFRAKVTGPGAVEISEERESDQ